MSTDEFRCTCDPNDLFAPPDPRPRAVEGCPAHRARRAAQQFEEQLQVRFVGYTDEDGNPIDVSADPLGVEIGETPK